MKQVNKQYIDIVYDRCVEEYNQICLQNPKIDAGHSVNHVKKVEKLTSKALYQYVFETRKRSEILEYIKEKFNGDVSCLDIPVDVILRMEAASLLHEVGDSKFADGSIKKSKSETIGQVLDRVFFDYDDYTLEMRQDIINMIDYCGASVWGDRVPPNSKVYQLIVRWADRLEATGIIGIIRTMTFSYVKRATYPLARDDDEYPTTMTELEQMAPQSRWLSYSSGKKPSGSGFSHYLDKIIHISGDDVPIPYLRDLLNENQKIVKQFVIDFTNIHNKQFDIDWILSQIDHDIYNVEVKQLKEMQQVMKVEGCKWIK